MWVEFFPPKICLLVLQIIISTMSASYSEGKAGGLSTGPDQHGSGNSSFLHKDSCHISAKKPNVINDIWLFGKISLARIQRMKSNLGWLLAIKILIYLLDN